MSAVVFALIAVMFVTKIVWNIAVPYILASRAFGGKRGLERGISLMPFVEIVLLAAAVVMALFRRNAWPWSAAGVALIGMGMIVGSYVHLIVVGGVASWIAQRLRGRHASGPPS